MSDNQENQNLRARARDANPDEPLPTEVFGPLLVSILRENGVLQSTFVKRLRDYGKEMTASSLSKLVKGQTQYMPALLLQIAMGQRERDARPLIIGTARYPDYAFLKCVASESDGDEGPMSGCVEFRDMDVPDLLQSLLRGDIHLTLMSDWRIERLSLAEKSSILRLAGKNNPVLHVRNNQMCVIGRDLSGVRTYEEHYMEACRKRLARRDRIGHALSMTLAQIPSNNSSIEISDVLQVVGGSWLAAFHKLVEIASKWLATRLEAEYCAAKANLKRIWDWVDAEFSNSDPTAHSSPLAVRAAAAHAKIREKAASKIPFYFVGNLAAMLLAEEDYPVPVIISNNAIHAITDLAHLLPDLNASMLSGIFFPRHYLISRFDLLDSHLQHQVIRLKKRWNSLVPKLAHGGEDLLEVSKAVDSVLEGDQVWECKKRLFEHIVSRRGFEFLAWL